MTNCCFKLAKVLLFTIDFIIMVISLVALGTGIWALVDSRALVDTIAFLTQHQSTIVDFYANTQFSFIAAAVITSLSGLMFLLYFAACWGVVSESRCLLIAQSVVTSIIIVLQLACIGTLYTTSSIWMGSVKRTLKDNFNKKYVGSLGTTTTGSYDAYSLSLDDFMLSFSCCGIDGPDDFSVNGTAGQWRSKGRIYQIPGGPIKVDDDVEIPTACCRFKNTTFFYAREYHQYGSNMENTMCPVQPKQDFITRGCFDVVPQEIAKYNHVLISVTVCVFVLQLITIILASTLASKIERWADELYY